MAELLELVLPIIDMETGRATPYFEDYLYRIIESIGGEGADSLTDVVSLIQNQGMFSARLNESSKRIDELRGLIYSEYKASENKLKRRVDELEQVVNSLQVGASRYSALENRINDLEQTLSVK